MLIRKIVYEQLNKTVRTARNTINLLLNIDPELEQNNHLKEALNCDLITAISDFLIRYASGKFNLPSSLTPEPRENCRKNIEHWTILISKTYRFLPTSIIERFFEQAVIIGGSNRRKVGDEIFRFLARLAREKQHQLTYFNLFKVKVCQQDKLAYQLESYI